MNIFPYQIFTSMFIAKVSQVRNNEGGEGVRGEGDFLKIIDQPLKLSTTRAWYVCEQN